VADSDTISTRSATQALLAMPEYRLQVARRRPQGGVDTDFASFDAETDEAAIGRAAELSVQILGGQPGVSILIDPTGWMIWSERQKMPAPPSL
jgi:hypothetical protein